MQVRRTKCWGKERIPSRIPEVGAIVGDDKSGGRKTWREGGWGKGGNGEEGMGMEGVGVV